MNESTRKQILVYKEALHYISEIKTENLEQEIAKDYAYYYYLTQQALTYSLYYGSEEYKEEKLKEGQEEELFEFDEETVLEQIRETKEEAQRMYAENRILRDYLKEKANETIVDSMMEKYGWI